ncbi:MAG: hypothetical protein U0414_09680 [Polyangiaceae bacterium]
MKTHIRSLSLLLALGVLELSGCKSGAEDGGGGAGGAGSTTGAAMGTTGSTAPTSSSSGQTTKTTEEVTGSISSDKTLTADKDWLLKGIVLVEAGATLTIEPGTKVMGDADTLGTLVVLQGAKIHAVGTKDAPVVFTSALPVGSRQAGDWGGVILLGKAPINQPGGSASVEGLSTSETYGGSNPDDSSGALEYVRIEFGGVELSPDNEINGLTLAGVGRGTTIDHVMVKVTLDDCFEFFGGTVDAKHLVCFRNGDDSFDADNGYTGRLQFLFSQKDPAHGEEDNGFEWDNDKDSSANAPITSPTVFNATLCGANADIPKEQYGMLLRRGTHGRIANTFITGFEACADVRNAPTSVTVDHDVCVGNTGANVAYVEDGSNMDTKKDDDAGLDDVAWFMSGPGDGVEGTLKDCFAATPDPRPVTPIAGVAPPNDGFFDAAPYVGAFKDATDDWMSGAWIDFSTQ